MEEGDRNVDAEEVHGRDRREREARVLPDRGTIEDDAEALERPRRPPGGHLLGKDGGELDDRRAVPRPRVERRVGVAEPVAPVAPEPFHADADVADGCPVRDDREPLSPVIVGAQGSAAVRAAAELLEGRPVDGGDPLPDQVGHHRGNRDRASHGNLRS